MFTKKWKPEVYQGRGRRRKYFEGWYFKQTDAAMAETWSIIPGISRGETEAESCSFIQVIEGRTGTTWWFEFPLEAFSASTRELDIKIGPNRFSGEGFHLELKSESLSLSGDIAFGTFASLPFSLLSPGVMGPFSFVPFMECSHGLVSLDHRLQGGLRVGERYIDFSDGRGYAEKDWGTSMPESWIWTQCNNFRDAGDSFMLSVAHIPWLGSSFTGFLCLARLGGQTHLFTTWNRSRIRSLSVSDSEIGCSITKRDIVIEIAVTRSRGGLLRAPVNGLLSRRIAESIDARLSLRLSRGGRVLFEGEGPNAGLEVTGDAAGL